MTPGQPPPYMKGGMHHLDDPVATAPLQHYQHQRRAAMLEDMVGVNTVDHGEEIVDEETLGMERRRERR